jgi:hypothetical protein
MEGSSRQQTKMPLKSTILLPANIPTMPVSSACKGGFDKNPTLTTSKLLFFPPWASQNDKNTPK